MSSSAPVSKRSSPVKITVVNGQRPGQSYIFDKGIITIGRGNDNDVSFAQDQKMSRNHLEIQSYGDRIFIRNVSQKNLVLMNNEKIVERAVSGPTLVQVGSMTLEVRSLENSPSLGHAPTLPPPPSSPSLMGKKFQEAKANSFNTTPRPMVARQGSRSTLYIIVIVVGAIIYWVISGDGPKKKPEINIRTEGDIVRSIEESAKAVQEIQTNQSKLGQDTLQYKSAQEHYIKGFRDYRQGQYSRAMQSFQAALSLFPAHELARKYYIQSQRKFEEQIDRTMSQGRKYYQKNNFRLCQSAFASAMIMIKDSSKAKYKEAKQLYNECSLRQEGRF